jgi:hypothetical protein
MDAIGPVGGAPNADRNWLSVPAGYRGWLQIQRKWGKYPRAWGENTSVAPRARILMKIPLSAVYKKSLDDLVPSSYTSREISNQIFAFWKESP